MVSFISGGELGGLAVPRDTLRTVINPGIPWTDYVQYQGNPDPEKMYKEQPSLRKVTGFIARNAAAPALHLYRKRSGTDRERVDDHTLARLLRRPSSHYTPARFRRMLLMDLALYDRYAFTVVDDEKGLRLALLPGRSVSFESNLLREVSQVKVATGTNESVNFDPAVTVHEFGWAAAKAEGVSPVITLARLLREQERSAIYRERLMDNAVAADQYIKRPVNTPWSDTGAQRFRDEWADFTATGAKAGRTPVLEDGMTLEGVPRNANAKTGDLEARTLSDAQVASTYWVPPELVGAREGTFSNIDAYRSMLYGPVLGPWIEDMAAAFGAVLIPLFGLDPDEYYIEANIRDRTRGTFLEEAAVSSTAAGGPYLTRNEVRARQNLPALPGGDELIVPLNVLVGGLASPRDTAPTKAASVVFDHGQPRPNVWAKSAGITDKPARGDLEAAIRSHFRAQALKVREELAAAKAADAPKVRFADVQRAYDVKASAAALTAAIEPHLFELASLSAASVVADFGRPDEVWDPEVMRAWLAKAAESHAQLMDTGWLTWVSAEVIDKAEWQVGLVEVADVRAADMASKWAQTAGNEAYSFGGVDAARWSGITQKEWIVTSPHARPSHSALAGQVVGLSETFTNGARWPSDSSLSAAEAAGCTCVLGFK